MIRYHTTSGILCQIVMCLGIINTSCRHTDSNPGDYSAYYLPLAAIPDTGLVYSYRNLADPAAGPEIWRHTTQGDSLIESVNYGPDHEVVQRQYDRVVSNGVITDSLLLFFQDTDKRFISQTSSEAAAAATINVSPSAMITNKPCRSTK